MMKLGRRHFLHLAAGAAALPISPRSAAAVDTTLSSSKNAVLFDNCQSLQNLTVTFHVTQDLVTSGNNGFSLQLNSYPQTKPQTTYKESRWIGFST